MQLNHKDTKAQRRKNEFGSQNAIHLLVKPAFPLELQGFRFLLCLCAFVVNSTAWTRLRSCEKSRDRSHERRIGRMARRERGESPYGALTSEQRRQTPYSPLAHRVALNFGPSCVAPQSQTHLGYAPSSRLAQAKFQQQCGLSLLFSQLLIVLTSRSRSSAFP